MLQLLRELNQGSAEQPAWEGKTDVHYIFLWNSSSLHLLDYQVLSCGIPEHPWRKSQYFQLQAKGVDFPLHVYHNHSPSTGLTLPRRKLVVKSLWDHATSKSTVAQPVVVLGGDFNCTPLQWASCFQHIMSTQAARRTVQECRNKTIPLHGDSALAMNVVAFQEDSRFGKS